MRRLLVLLLLALGLAAGTSANRAGAAQAASACPYTLKASNGKDLFPPVGPKLPVFGRLTIGSIGLSTPIFRGSWPDMSTEASKSLMYGPALYPQAGMGWPNHYPGQGGTVGIAGHRTTRTHPMCLAARVPNGAYATIRVNRKKIKIGRKAVMYQGYWVYRKVASITLSGTDDSAFQHPWRYDPHPKKWHKGIRPEYLVIGACDPPGSATYRINLIFKLVAQYAQ